MIERLKICWYALTKKEYVFAAFDERVQGIENKKSRGAVCFIKTLDNKEQHPFLSAIISYLQLVIDKNLY